MMGGVGEMTRMSTSAAAVRVVVYFDVGPGREEDFVQRCRELGVVGEIERHGGFLGGELCRAADGSSLVVLTMLWASDAAYRSWRDACPRLPSSSCPHLGFQGPPQGDVLDVVHQMRPTEVTPSG